MNDELQHSLSSMFEGIENGLTVKLADRTLVFHLPTLDDLTEIELMTRNKRMLAYEDFAESMRKRGRPIPPKVHTEALIALAGRCGDVQDTLKSLIAEPDCFKRLLFYALNPKKENSDEREDNVPLDGIDKVLRDILTAGKFKDFVTKFIAKQSLGAESGEADPTEAAISDSLNG